MNGSLSESGPEAVPTSTGDENAVDIDVTCCWCRYNLRGAQANGRCPECGALISLSLPISQDNVQTNHRQPAIACVSCRTPNDNQRRHELCKECGTPVWFTQAPVWLRDSDSTWLRKIRFGLGIWQWTLIVGIATGFIVGVVGMSLAIALRKTSGEIQTISMFIGVVIGTVTSLLNAWIAWTLSQPHPSEPDHLSVWRKIMRVGCMCSAALALCNLIIHIAGVPVWVTLAISICGLPLTVVTIGLFVHLRDFAMRIPSRALYRDARILMWAYCGTTITMAVLGVVSVALNDPSVPIMGPQSPQVMIVSCTTGVVGLVSVALTVWLIVDLVRMRRAIRQVLGSLTSVATST